MKTRFRKYLPLFLLLFSALLMGAAPMPPGGSTGSSKASFTHAAPFSYQYVCNEVRQFVPLITNVVVASLVSMGGGTAAVAEINTSEIGGLTLDADAESASVIWMLPGDIDVAQPIYVRVLFSESSGSATGTFAIALTYTAVTVGTDALAVAATSTGVTNGAAVADSATAHVMQWTSESTIAASTFSDTPGDSLIILKAAADLTTITDATVYGFQIRYARRFLGCQDD